MKAHFKKTTGSRGSVLLTVMMIIFIMALLSVSIISYSNSETRSNERNTMTLHSRNMAENIALYAAEQLTTKLYRLGATPVGVFPWSGSSTSVIKMPPTSTVLLSDYNTTAANMEVRSAIEAATPYALVTDTTNPNYGLQVATATVPIIAKGTATHPRIGTSTTYIQQDMRLVLTPLFQFGMFYNMDLELYPSAAFTVTGPVHTNNNLMAHANWGSTVDLLFTDRVTAAEYVIADHSLKAEPRVGNGSKPAATPDNGNVIFRKAGTITETSLKDTGDANKWRDSRWKTTNNPPTSTNVGSFTPWATTTYAGNLRAGAHGVTKLVLPGIGDYKEVDDPATAVDDRNNGRQMIESPDHKRYNGTSFAATVDTGTLKQVKISWRAGLYIMVNPDDLQVRSGKLPDGTTVTLLPRTYRCWLNTITSGVSTMKEVILPGQPAYGSGPGVDGTAGTADDVMFKNNLPNQFTNTTAVGMNQVLRIPAGPWNVALLAGGPVTGNADIPAGSALPTANATIDASLPNTTGYATTGGSGAVFPADLAASPYAADAYFFDIRRANGNGKMSSANDATAFGRSGSNVYTPRPIAKIDFDMGRFKMMVNRVIFGATTSNGYKLNLPDGTGTGWANCIYNSSATPTNIGLGVRNTVTPFNYDVFPDTSSAPNKLRRDPFQLYYAPVNTTEQAAVLVDPTVFAVSNTSLKAAWYDGVAVYIHSVDAEMRAQTITAGVNDRTDSGVRFLNGRGPAPSLTESARTGCTIATNDPIYIIGHYNADGAITPGVNDTGSGSPNFYNGFSAKYPDSSSEKLCSLYGDAFNALSQPTFTQSGSSPSYTYAQTGGWCDAFSALSASGSVASWATAAAGGQDGVYITTGIKPGILPNLNTPGSLGTATTTKFSAGATEISTALVTGIVPSNHSPTGLTDRSPNTGANNVNSGGANNYPRLLENWGGNGLYIRGSIVGLFESRIAMEPFTHSRCYGAPGRYWGLHYNFSQVNHDVPLEPIVLTANRLGFRQLSSAQYATKKTALEAMTLIP